jgi:uncharacterized membrane protein
MAFCTKCGSSVAEGLAVCPQCGAPTGPVAAGAPVGAAPVAGTTGLQENVAGLLCYLLGWVTGIIFLVIDKRPFVRFHAAQSIVVFGALFILREILAYGVLGMHAYGFWSLWWLIYSFINLVAFVLWILLMVMAFQGKRFEVPIAAPFAKSLAGSSKI